MSSNDAVLAVNPLQADILADLVKHTQDSVTSVLDIQDEIIEYWKTQFLSLFQSVVETTDEQTSDRLAAVICGFAGTAEQALN